MIQDETTSTNTLMLKEEKQTTTAEIYPPITKAYMRWLVKRWNMKHKKK
jgi:hypothetical protein